MAMAPERTGIGISRHFVPEGADPYDQVAWERRDSRITNWKDGSVAFEQLGVEVPASWSLNATNILAQKYFRGTLGTPAREGSLKQVADRVVDTITAWGRKDGYFTDDAEADAFAAELKYLIITQRAAFNSPVWFNIGVEGVPQQASACFILSVDDHMKSILNWYVEEGTIFKGGSGSGINLSRIRSSVEPLEGGGTASGPVSFMRGADASAGTIKSGGKTRRAAKMVILNADHPDIEDFIWCKALEERKARVLRDAGFDMDLDGKDSASLQYQNANNSVRVTDEFMQAVVDDADWHLRAVTTGEVVRTVKARDLMRQISEATWQCADPGMQFDTTINRWNTAAATGRINGSNPCFTGDALVHTDKGLVRFDELVDRTRLGESFGVYTHDATNLDAPAERIELTRPDAVMITGTNEVVRLRFDNGMELRCTPGHRIFTVNRGYVEAEELTADDEVKVLDLPAPATGADLTLPVPSDVAAYAVKGDWSRSLRLPEKWTPELAHYLGWLVGDGCISGDVVTTVYGNDDDKASVLPSHLALLTEINGGRAPRPSVQGNGTVQLRQSRRVIARYLEALGISHAKAADKVVPWSVEQAPPEAVGAFLRGLFDADGCVYDGANSRYVGLGSVSRELLTGVQRLLSTFGIFSRIYKTRGGQEDAFTHVRKDGTFALYEGGALYDLRISARSIAAFASHVGFRHTAKADKLERLLARRGFHAARETVRLVERVDDGFETTYNLSEPRNHSYVVNGVVVRNCSEYMHLDDSACNLASINLLKFLDDGDDRFDVEGYKHAVEVVFTAQEILVGNADYPTEGIAETSRRFRQLGIGYANLGALLMALGLPYDSDAGRAWAGALTALMTGHAYATSARTASRMGPFAGYTDNAEHMLRVLRMHREEAAHIDEDLVPPEVLGAAQHAWDEAVEVAEVYGVRNSQASVLAPTGTIGLLMDCDTTGIEPDLGLCKMKKLVGGGTMTIVNQTVPRALRRLGYDAGQIEDIVAYIDENKSILGAPHLSPEHVPVFACSMGDNAIHYSGHVRMMGAAQPFLSGAISKCVVGETLVATADGLVRIGSLRGAEAPDTFRHEVLEVASLGGEQKTDAFYYGGVRPVRSVVLRSGHSVVGTPNHRVLVADHRGLDWKRLDEIEVGDHVAQQYGADLWSPLPARLDDFTPSATYGCQKRVEVPSEMSTELAFLLGAYASEGHTTRSNWTISITNSVPAVRERVVAAWASELGLEAKVVSSGDRCPQVVVASKTAVELLDHLGCGDRSSAKRIPDAILRSPREMVLAFLQGLALDAYVTVASAPKWGICLDSPRLLDDLQVVLTNLGVVHGRVTKRNKVNGKSYDEVYASGDHARVLVELVPFLEPGKAERAAAIAALPSTARRNTADVVPGITPYELYGLLPLGTPGRNGHGVRSEFAYLCDARTRHVTRSSLERVAAVPGVSLPQWLRSVLDDNLHFSPVESTGAAGEREVFDLSVPATQALVANGIVNHNTVNMPEEATVEDVEQLHVDAWRLGIKAVAIYRDNCKVAQPLSMAKKGEKQGTADAPNTEAVAPAPVEVVERIVERIVAQPTREKLPRNRRSRTFEFRVADCKGFVTVGEYDDGRPGEVFMKVSKQGSTLAGIMDAFAISVSHGLQYGVPLKAFVEAFTNMRFEPAGMTDDPDIRFASSLVDYIFRRMAVDYLPLEERMELGILSVGERTAPTLPGIEEAAIESSAGLDVVTSPPGDNTPSIDLTRAEGITPAPMAYVPSADAPICMLCGVQMQRAGSCHACPSCGSTSGCS
jgi:ribonucleoside-diphosphate reductase alpha chain